MRHPPLLAAAAACALALGCTSTSRQELPAVIVEAQVRAECTADAGTACSEIYPNVRPPFCGPDFNRLEPGTLVVVHSGSPANRIDGVLEVRTLWVDLPDGGAEELSDRRRVLVSEPTASVFAAFGDTRELYAIDLDGRTYPFGLDGGSSEPVDGGFAFHYSESLGDGGEVRYTETHAVNATWRAEIEIVDHSNDTFYGCCAHVPASDAALVATAVLASLALARPRPRRV